MQEELDTVQGHSKHSRCNHLSSALLRGWGAGSFCLEPDEALTLVPLTYMVKCVFVNL